VSCQPRGSFSTIGRSVPRVDSVAKVTGQCPYTADIQRPGALWGKFLRSPFPHARIVRLDTAKAKTIAGVKAVITGREVSPRREGYTLRDKPIFAQDRVLYAGEKVAAVAAQIPNIKDIPELVTSLVAAKVGPGPFGVKAVAEAGISVVAPAVANAVYNATGVRITELPITAEKILRGMACH
jgi:CO/xanthine dehydrogenase Mo-binding subunit